MQDTYSLTTADWEQYVSLLHSFSAMGAAMRFVIAKAVTNPQVYTNLTQGVCDTLDVPMMQYVFFCNFPKRLFFRR